MKAVNFNPVRKLSKSLDKKLSDLVADHVFSEDDLCNLYMIDPSRLISRVNVDTEIKLNLELELDTSLCPVFTHIKASENTTDDDENDHISDTELQTYLDEVNQSSWFLPDTYKDFDIAKYVIDLCKTDAELQRVGEELIMYQERELFPLLRYMKYLVDTMRANNIVWGVGRGSSVASYVLYLLEVHRINSMYYDLQITDFLKEM